MKKLLALMVMLILSAPLTVISTEKTYQPSNQTVYDLSVSKIIKDTYFDTIPSNPNLYTAVTIYKDSQLMIPQSKLQPNTSFTIDKYLINDDKTPVFQLKNGGYIEASRLSIYDDQLLSQENAQGIYWVDNHFLAYQNPYVNGEKTIKTKLSPYTEIKISQKAVTSHGTFFKVDGQGWIAEANLSKEDNRIDKVQEMLNKKYNKANLSVFVQQIGTKKSAGINTDHQMYSASIAKLPLLFYVSQQLKQGKLKVTDHFRYVEVVNHFDGAYKTEGSGKMPKEADQKEYSVEDLLKAVTQHSDNVATNILAYYVANQYDKNYHNVITQIDNVDWNMSERKVSAKTAAQVMEAIYRGKARDIMSYLSSTEFDAERIPKKIAAPVAHKIGDAYDFKHDVAIVYAGKPFVLSIFTEKSSYDEIADIAADIYGILK